MPASKPQDVASYIAAYPDWRGEVMQDLHDLILGASPRAAAVIKWSQPVFEHEGPFAYFKAAAKHVTFGFWRGSELEDPKGWLHGSGAKMAHVKITEGMRLPRTQIRAWTRQAIRLNREKGDPTKRS